MAITRRIFFRLGAAVAAAVCIPTVPILQAQTALDALTERDILDMWDYAKANSQPPGPDGHYIIYVHPDTLARFGLKLGPTVSIA